MASIIKSTTTDGIQIIPDSTGAFAIQTNGANTALTIDTSQNATFSKNIVLNGSTSGTVTLAAPSVAGSTTLTLPTTTGTLVTSNAMPTGSVVQVVQGTLGTQASSSSSTMADTGVTASITPKSSSNKILVIVQLNACGKQTGDTYMRVKLVRGSTDIQVMDSLAGYTATTAFNWIGSISSTYLDSPATTSSTTYKVQFSSANNVAAVYINGNSGGFLPVSTITLLEIAA